MPPLEPNRVKLVLHIWRLRPTPPNARRTLHWLYSDLSAHYSTLSHGLQHSDQVKLTHLSSSFSRAPDAHRQVALSLPAFPQQQLARLSGIKAIPLNVLVPAPQTGACLLRVIGTILHCSFITILFADDDQEGQLIDQECIR